MAKFSLERKMKVLTFKRKMTQRDIARRLGIYKNSVQTFRNTFATTGSVLNTKKDRKITKAKQER